MTSKTSGLDVAKRKYNRRSDEQRIAELEARIKKIREREKAKEQRESPLLKEALRLQRQLRKFAQNAMDQSRPDIANSTTAFVSALERMTLPDKPAAPPLAE